MIEVLRWIPNSKWLRVGLAERVPDHVEPVRVAELGGLVPLVRRQADGLTTRASLRLNPADSVNGIAVSCLRVSGPEASYVESDLKMPHALALPAANLLLVCHDDVL